MMICQDNKTNGAVGMLTNWNTEEVLIKIYNNNDKKSNNKLQQRWNYLLRAVFCEAFFEFKIMAYPQGWTARGSIQSLRPSMAVSQQRGLAIELHDNVLQ
ncbi:MAG: hypothetical protein EZS28_007553 [Streblomastix strix]|uniref:Uncharacterized protein n=1 Tax=Streblomastix strix TaxID=222440 RepID=A0A5J4WRB3_9EUKA|nr:MAG: hypothetical protein EZS28_007553 [Streblomastix strix]